MNDELIFLNGQYYAHYKYWEDFINGFYHKKSEVADGAYVINVLKDNVIFLKGGKAMVDDWTYTCTINLSDNSINKRAWIGQMTCYYLYGVSDDITRKFWWKLTSGQQARANKTADKIYNYWKNKYYSKQLCLKLS